ncbi:MAG: nickel pincer cofactor biosynthesis protein LarC [Actinomycetota bacterium]|nr:nickel pincer cofactor biosynthesis protein LarC [Actinomycetota bacterium]
MIAYLDCTSGISGDKFLAALIDAGLAEETLAAALDSLGIGARVATARAVRGGFEGLSLRVDSGDVQPSRNWCDIRALISSSALDAPVIEGALAAFDLLARAEALVHGVPVDEVYFHEVGAVDSIADIVGVALGLHVLGITGLYCSPVSLGWGTVDTEHGTLPVPAPATAELLQGIPVVGGPAEGEMTTPTGAALLRAHVVAYGPMPAMRVERIGRGAGSRELSVPNVARLFFGEAEHGEAETEPVVLLESNIDHLSPEHAAFAAEQLLEDGALDVWQTPIVMKKGRAATLISVLVRAGDEARTAASIMELTGTLGVRIAPTARYAATRTIVHAETIWGPVAVKVADFSGAPRYRAEYEDCARIAREQGVPIREVCEAAERAARDDSA